MLSGGGDKELAVRGLSGLDGDPSADPQSCLPSPCLSTCLPCLQVNAFCNTDDITWGTKNLDTKRDATEAKTLMKQGLGLPANQVGSSGVVCVSVLKDGAGLAPGISP